jgi:hypothetical protein
MSPIRVWKTPTGAPQRGQIQAVLMAANIRSLSERDRYCVWRVWILILSSDDRATRRHLVLVLAPLLRTHFKDMMAIYILFLSWISQYKILMKFNSSLCRHYRYYFGITSDSVAKNIHTTQILKNTS